MKPELSMHFPWSFHLVSTTLSTANNNKDSSIPHWIVWNHSQILQRIINLSSNSNCSLFFVVFAPFIICTNQFRHFTNQNCDVYAQKGAISLPLADILICQVFTLLYLICLLIFINWSDKFQCLISSTNVIWVKMYQMTPNSYHNLPTA